MESMSCSAFPQSVVSLSARDEIYVCGSYHVRASTDVAPMEALCLCYVKILKYNCMHNPSNNRCK